MIVVQPHLTDVPHIVYSRLRSDLSEVVEELRQVSLKQPLKLQAQSHDTLREHTRGSRDINTQTGDFDLGYLAAVHEKTWELTEGDDEMECNLKK